MLNRVPRYPGRVTLTPVPGQANKYDMVRADEPTQEGTPLNKGSLLSDATCAALSIPTTSVPDDAFAKLAVGEGKYGYYLTVKFADGKPAVGVSVTGILKSDGNACITDNNGNVLGVSTSASPTISITGYIDLQSYSQRITSTDIITPITITLTDAANIGTITSSQTVKFSRDMLVDLHLISSGQDGDDNSTAGYQKGGNSGYAYYIVNTAAIKNTTYSAVIGAQYSAATTLLGKSSLSGTYAVGGTTASINGSGGGVSPISSSLIVGGSGGHGVNAFFGVPSPGIGSNGGGNGGNENVNGGNGRNPGAGGGGAGIENSLPGAGASGAIYYKWRLA